jgi:hypothetical protein
MLSNFWRIRLLWKIVVKNDTRILKKKSIWASYENTQYKKKHYQIFHKLNVYKALINYLIIDYFILEMQK